ncbi:hypothetical protein H4S14_000801 [Agrobacterium vitis]|nr:hypothetical protein [Agrobacterium vitis]MBE1437074.1 hypothetical protein [Agrobacterium vitis]
MLAPEALRLLTVEILRPTAAMDGTVPFPLVAGRRVNDSREISVQDIDPDQPYTPVVGVYSGDATISPRGDLNDFTDVEHKAVLDIVVELAIVSSDDAGEFADAMASNDPQARMVLAALCSKIRYLLEFSQAGAPWRKIAKRIVELEAIPFAVPHIGLRFQRITLRYTIELSADVYNVADGGLPEPIRSVFAGLPAGSYAKKKLAELAGYFLAETPDQLHELTAQASLGSAETIDVGVTLTAP